MPRRRSVSGIIACRKCGRVYALSKLTGEGLKRENNMFVCSYCGNTDFTREIHDIILVIDAKRSKVAKYLGIDMPIVITRNYE